MALNKVYAVYGSDIECPGLIKVFSKKEDAEKFMRDVIEYNKTRPYTDNEMCEALDAGDDAFAIALQHMDSWKKAHPNDFADLYEEFFISEIEVH